MGSPIHLSESVRPDGSFKFQTVQKLIRLSLKRVLRLYVALCSTVHFSQILLFVVLLNTLHVIHLTVFSSLKSLCTVDRFKSPWESVRMNHSIESVETQCARDSNINILRQSLVTLQSCPVLLGRNTLYSTTADVHLDHKKHWVIFLKIRTRSEYQNSRDGKREEVKVNCLTVCFSRKICQADWRIEYDIILDPSAL